MVVAIDEDIGPDILAFSITGSTYLWHLCGGQRAETKFGTNKNEPGNPPYLLSLLDGLSCAHVLKFGGTVGGWITHHHVASTQWEI